MITRLREAFADIKLEKDYPWIFPVVLGLMKPSIQMALSSYKDEFLVSDIAFAALSFDLWAFLTLNVFGTAAGQNESFTNRDKICVYGLTFYHFFLFFIFVILAATKQAQPLLGNVLLSLICSVTITYFPARSFLRHVFN